MLLYVEGEVVEIRPGEFFESTSLVDTRYLEIINQPSKIKKIGRPKKKSLLTTFEEKSNASSSP